MRPTLNRRTGTKVKAGRVQRKNRHRPTAHEGFVLDRESPGRGFIHVVTKRDVQAFLDIIPEWNRFSERLERIVLARYSDNADGIYRFYHREETGSIFLHAWAEDLWVELTKSYFGPGPTCCCTFSCMSLDTITTARIRSTTAPRKARSTRSGLTSMWMESNAPPAPDARLPKQTGLLRFQPEKSCRFVRAYWQRHGNGHVDPLTVHGRAIRQPIDQIGAGLDNDGRADTSRDG